MEVTVVVAWEHNAKRKTVFQLFLQGMLARHFPLALFLHPLFSTERKRRAGLMCISQYSTFIQGSLYTATQPLYTSCLFPVSFYSLSLANRSISIACHGSTCSTRRRSLVVALVLAAAAVVIAVRHTCSSILLQV